MPEDEHVGGLGGAGGGRQQREVAAVGVGGEEDGLVAADVRLRATGRPSSGRATACAGCASRLIAVTPSAASACVERRVEERLEQPDDDLAAAQPGDLVGRRLLDAQDDVGLAYRLGGRRRPSRRPRRTPRRGSGRRRRRRPRRGSRSPAAVSLPSASGTRATRRSPGAVSLATPTFMGTTLGRGRARSLPDLVGIPPKDTRSCHDVDRGRPDEWSRDRRHRPGDRAHQERAGHDGGRHGLLQRRPACGPGDLSTGERGSAHHPQHRPAGAHGRRATTEPYVAPRKSGVRPRIEPLLSPAGLCHGRLQRLQAARRAGRHGGDPQPVCVHAGRGQHDPRSRLPGIWAHRLP